MFCFEPWLFILHIHPGRLFFYYRVLRSMHLAPGFGCFFIHTPRGHNLRRNFGGPCCVGHLVPVYATNENTTDRQPVLKRHSFPFSSKLGRCNNDMCERDPLPSCQVTFPSPHTPYPRAHILAYTPHGKCLRMGARTSVLLFLKAKQFDGRYWSLLNACVICPGISL